MPSLWASALIAWHICWVGSTWARGHICGWNHGAVVALSGRIPFFGSKLTYEYPIHDMGGDVRIFMRRKRWQADLNPGLHDMQGAKDRKASSVQGSQPLAPLAVRFAFTRQLQEQYRRFAILTRNNNRIITWTTKDMTCTTYVIRTIIKFGFERK
ncbi:hypothetical protein PoMZ_11312 [Pyricularia oryzae]|uniref:Secreted protein n=1 Tax=Pyricularia oryzae TaxID=318829 RepID=A0A4P7NK67_PYROR|nr:hypothetical protein PoMZ_11312 [Pyricularia oryzae]